MEKPLMLLILVVAILSNNYFLEYGLAICVEGIAIFANILQDIFKHLL
jgi:hypothetical protein